MGLSRKPSNGCGSLLKNVWSGTVDQQLSKILVGLQFSKKHLSRKLFFPLPLPPPKMADFIDGRMHILESFFSSYPPFPPGSCV